MSCRQAVHDLTLQPTSHAGLWLDRYLRNPEAQGAKQEHIEAVIKEIRVPEVYRTFFAHWKAFLEALPDTALAKATARGRIIVGLGAESVLETSISLHRTYGLPYLPGSGLKGLAAAAAHRHLEDHPKWRKAVGGQPIGSSHRALFGDQESSGTVIFHDALWWPENGSTLPLDLDVITVHHGDYYLGQQVPPADWDNPVPVSFVSARGSYLLALTGPADWVDVTLAILKDALDLDGVGAKTAAGYGRMDLSSLASPSSQTAWEGRVRNITISNAEHEVPRLLAELKGEARRKAAQAVKTQLKSYLRDPERKKRTWVQQLLEAAGE